MPTNPDFGLSITVCSKLFYSTLQLRFDRVIAIFNIDFCNVFEVDANVVSFLKLDLAE